MSLWLCAQSGGAPVSAKAAADQERLAASLQHTWPLPAWCTLLVFALVAALVIAIYLREQGSASRRRRLGLAAVRLALLTLVIFMLYGWTRQLHRLDPPDLIFALDRSASMSVVDVAPVATVSRREQQRMLQSAGLSEASRFDLARAVLLQPRDGWLDRSVRDYRVKLYGLGQSAQAIPGGLDQRKEAIRQLRPDAPSSRLGQSLSEILDAERGRPTAAIVLLTDGVTTDGQTISSAAEAARQNGVPLFLLGLGSERPPLDLQLSDLLVDDLVFLDEMVNFEAQMRGEGLGGRDVTVRLKRADRPQVLAEQTLTLPRDGSSQRVRLAHRAIEEGEFEFVVEATPVEGELNQANNRLSQRVRVRDATLRVLLAQADPSYEYRFLKDLLSRAVRVGKDGTTRAIELTTVLQEADIEQTKEDPSSRAVFPVSREELFSYDVLVLGDVNPAFLSSSVMDHIVAFVTERGGGVVFVAGPLFMPMAYRDTPLARLFPVDLSSASAPATNEWVKDPFLARLTPLGSSAPHLQLGETPAETERIWRQLPGLRWFVSTPDVRPAARVLAVHSKRAGLRGEPLPILSLQFVGAGKVILQNTDETYLWSRYPGDPRYYSRYWLQTLRYLSRSRLQSRDQAAEITTDRQQYRLGDPVQVRVRFLDDRQAPDQDGGVVVVVQQVGGRQQQLTLHRDPLRGELFAGTLSGLLAGEYRVWRAAAEQSEPRTFSVAAAPDELTRVAMDSADLRKAASVSQGRFATLADASRLFAKLPTGRRVTIESLPPKPLWNSPWAAILFVALISIEWLLRKRNGML